MVIRADAATLVERGQRHVPQPTAAGLFTPSSCGSSWRPCALQRLDLLRPVLGTTVPPVHSRRRMWAGLACTRLPPRDVPISPVMSSCRPTPITARMANAGLLIWLAWGPVAEVRCWALRGRGARSGSGRCSLLLEAVTFLCGCLFPMPVVALRRLVLVTAGVAVLPMILTAGAVDSPTSTPSSRREGGGEETCCTVKRLLLGGPDPCMGALHLTALCTTRSGTRVRAASPCGHPRSTLQGMRERLSALPIGSGRPTKTGGRTAIAARATAEEEMRNEARNTRKQRGGKRQKAQRRDGRRGLIAAKAMNPRALGGVAVAESILATGYAGTPTPPRRREGNRGVDVQELAVLPVFA